MILYYCHVSGLTSGACVVGPGVALGFIGALLTPSGQVTWKCDTILPTLYSEEGRNAKICVQETWYNNCFVVFFIICYLIYDALKYKLTSLKLHPY